MTPPHLLRDVLTRGGSFHSAVHALSATPLISDVYYIVGGTNVTEGVVLSRAQTKVDHADWIGAKKPPIGTLEPDWFVVQTNYDNWNLNKTRFNPLPSPQNPNVPIFDNRREVCFFQCRCLFFCEKNSIFFLNFVVFIFHFLLLNQ